MMKSPSNACINPNNSSSDLTNHKRNTNFMRKIPPGAEANNILVGEVDCLKKILVVFIRLKKGTFLGDLTEVPIPSRFVITVDNILIHSFNETSISGSFLLL